MIFNVSFLNLNLRLSFCLLYFFFCRQYFLRLKFSASLPWFITYSLVRELCMSYHALHTDSTVAFASLMHARATSPLPPHASCNNTCAYAYAYVRMRTQRRKSKFVIGIGLGKELIFIKIQFPIQVPIYQALYFYQKLY